MRKDLRALSLKRRQHLDKLPDPKSQPQYLNRDSFKHSQNLNSKSHFMDSEIFGRNTMMSNKLRLTQNLGEGIAGGYGQFVESRLDSGIMDHADDQFMFEEEDGFDADLDLDAELYDDGWEDESEPGDNPLY